MALSSSPQCQGAATFWTSVTVGDLRFRPRSVLRRPSDFPSEPLSVRILHGERPLSLVWCMELRRNLGSGDCLKRRLTDLFVSSVGLQGYASRWFHPRPIVLCALSGWGGRGRHGTRLTPRQHFEHMDVTICHQYASECAGELQAEGEWA